MLKTRIGKILGILPLAATLVLAVPGSRVASAADTQFSAQVDHKNIGMDDSVSLKFTVRSKGSVSTSPPKYDAPDFEEINSYNSSFVESYYDSNTGQISMRNNQMLTKVLRPLKQGTLLISHIRAIINGKVHKVPDIKIQVGPAGSGTPPPQNYGGSGVGLRGAMKQPASKNRVFVRAEVDKDKVYKGEQVVVSYYLYRRVRVLNAEVDKFPTLNGFLKEEMEMPVMQPRLDADTVVLDGVTYQRSLLARYAAYPLKEGKLKIDPLGLKYTYYVGGGNDDGEDPFLQFFRQLTPEEATSESEPVSVNVMPLPADGRPSSFSGAVGDFTISASVDKTEVPANEALTLTLRIKGQGNVAAIGEPKAKWPANVELYDSKGITKKTQDGVGEKDFQILLIPRVPGSMTLPSLKFSYFDPSKKQYITRTTDPIPITVTQPLVGSTPPQMSNPVVTKPDSSHGAGTPSAGLHDIKPLGAVASSWNRAGLPSWRLMYILAVAALILFAGWIGIDLLRGVRGRRRQSAENRARTRERSWEHLRAEARKSASAPWAEVLHAYDRLCGNVLDAIDRLYSIGARSISRAEIRRILVEERGLSATQWDPLDRLLDFNETIRFAGAASATLETRARMELNNWVQTAESSVRTLEQLSQQGSSAN